MFAFIFIAFNALQLNAQTPSNLENAQQYAQKADVAAKAGNYKSAISFYRKAAQLFEEAAKVFASKNQTPNANNYFAKAATASSRAGICFKRLNNFEGAYKAHQKAAKLYHSIGQVEKANVEKKLALQAQQNAAKGGNLREFRGHSDILSPAQRGENVRDRDADSSNEDRDRNNRDRDADNPNEDSEDQPSDRDRERDDREEEEGCRCENLSYSLHITLLDEEGRGVEEKTLRYSNSFTDGEELDSDLEVEKGQYALVSLQNIEFNCSCSGDESGCNNISGGKDGNTFTRRGRPDVKLRGPSGTNNNANCQSTSQGTMRIERERFPLGWDSDREPTKFDFMLLFQDENLNGNPYPYQYIEVRGYCYDENCGSDRNGRSYTFCKNRLKLKFK